MDLTTILRSPEGKALEFKRDLSSPDGVLKAIIAFANTSGGAVLIGVEDVVAFLRKHMTREAVIGEVKRTDVWTLPDRKMG